MFENHEKVVKIQMRPFLDHFKTPCYKYQVQKVGQKYNSSGPNGFHSALFFPNFSSKKICHDGDWYG